MSMEQFFLVVALIVLMLRTVTVFVDGAMADWGSGWKENVIGIVGSVIYVGIATIVNVEIVEGFRKAGYEVIDWGMLLFWFSMIVFAVFEPVRVALLETDRITLQEVWIHFGRLLVAAVTHECVEPLYRWNLNRYLVLTDNWMQELAQRFMLWFVIIEVVLAVRKYAGRTGREHKVVAVVSGKAVKVSDER